MPKCDLKTSLSTNNHFQEKAKEEADSTTKIMNENFRNDLNEINSIFSNINNHVVKNLNKLSMDASIRKSSN
jgi:hypothetical protein